MTDLAAIRRRHALRAAILDGEEPIRRTFADHLEEAHADATVLLDHADALAARLAAADALLRRAAPFLDGFLDAYPNPDLDPCGHEEDSDDRDCRRARWQSGDERTERIHERDGDCGHQPTLAPLLEDIAAYFDTEEPPA
jgi:hypothetical protein